MKYKLTKEELTRQIHQTLRELYSDVIITSDDIKDKIHVTKDGITFLCSDFASEMNFNSAELIQNLYIELGIEFEKNLHDKYYFMMTKDDESLHFRILENN
jgi:hypothetical protein